MKCIKASICKCYNVYLNATRYREYWMGWSENFTFVLALKSQNGVTPSMEFYETSQVCQLYEATDDPSSPVPRLAMNGIRMTNWLQSLSRIHIFMQLYVSTPNVNRHISLWLINENKNNHFLVGIPCYVHPRNWNADHSGRAAKTMKCLRSLEQWNSVFESHSRRGIFPRLVCACFYMQVAALRRADRHPRGPIVCKIHDFRLLLNVNRP
jgi:hypothetical protein